MIHVASCKRYAAFITAVEKRRDVVDASVALGFLLDVLVGKMKRCYTYLRRKGSHVAMVSEVHDGKCGIYYPGFIVAFLLGAV